MTAQDTKDTALNAKLASGPTTDTGPVCSGLLDDEITSTKLAPVVQLAAINTKDASAQAAPTVDLALDAKLASGPTPDTPPVCSGLLEPSTKPAPVVQLAALSTDNSEKKALFFSAFHFAVAGASTDKKKYGFKTLKRLVDLGKDVVPVNPNATESRLFVTLAVLKEAKTLQILVLWLQPGAEDDAVVEFIEADAQLKERCIYQDRHPAPCLLTTTAHRMPPTPVAGQKHAILSPPSTPPVAKSLKLSEESTASPRQNADSLVDLADEIPGLP
ncbi:hypothetical protein B0H16DRAFT_1446818 [Mycena metata]|uniref:CoA-binding domain-containing protein n=1 Tax=Mycena metata TaxID=1033252 RepID=A0AAD7KFN1_9AGAR|nr:hypothetical protein B0H16DRAFT_1446818 [Mycena metata]